MLSGRGPHTEEVESTRGKMSQPESKNQQNVADVDIVTLGKQNVQPWGKNAQCSKPNHFAKMCKTKHTKVHTVHERDTDSNSADHFYVAEIIRNKSKDEVFVPIKLSAGNKVKTVNFKLDTGAQVNVIPAKSYKNWVFLCQL